MQYYKDRKLQHNQKVYVYFNLHKNLFSVKALEGEYKGKIVLHTNELSLDLGTFVVSQSGRERVLREKRKNVHAGVIGNINLEDTYKHSMFETEVTYNPYIYNSFVLKENEQPIKEAQKVIFEGKKVYIKRPEK